MPWETLALLGVLALWGLLGASSWFIALVAAGPARVGLLALALTFAAGMGGGALVPALGGKDAFGFGISLAAALVTGAAASLIVALPQIYTDEHR